MVARGHHDTDVARAAPGDSNSRYACGATGGATQILRRLLGAQPVQLLGNFGGGRIDRQQPLQLLNGQVGYKYGYWGVFWIDLWTHDGTYCLYEGDRYKPIEPAEAARLLGKSEGELSKPFLYRVPLGWFLFPPLLVPWVKTVCQQGSVTLSVVHPLVGTVGAVSESLR